MPLNSKMKGKAGELEACKVLERILGIAHERSVQYCGRAGDADIKGVEGLHLEVKRVEKMNLYDAMKQAESDAPDDKVPVVMHRKNRKGWVMIINAEDMISFAHAILDALETPNANQ